jgi:membrane protease YdiL (CAAX protease family)
MGVISKLLTETWSCLISTVGIFFVFTVPVLFYLNGTKTSLSELLVPSTKASPKRTCKLRNTVLSLIFATAITVSAVNVTSIATDYVFSLFGIASNQITRYTHTELVFIFFRNVLISSVLEELLFRGVVLNAAKELSNTKKVLIGALLFALMHCNLYSFFYAFAAGAAITYFVIKASSVAFGIAIHFLQNLFAFSFTVLRCYATKSVYNTASTVSFYLLLALALIGLCLMIASNVKKIKRNAPANANSAILRSKSDIFTPELVIYILSAAVITAFSF